MFTKDKPTETLIQFIQRKIKRREDEDVIKSHWLQFML